MEAKSGDRNIASARCGEATATNFGSLNTEALALRDVIRVHTREFDGLLTKCCAQTHAVWVGGVR